MRTGGGADASARSTRPDWVNLPNLISVLRLIVFVPLTVWLMSLGDRQILATISLLVFSGSDWIDGFLARRWNQTTKVGALLDPIADRLGIIIISISMLMLGILQPWVVYTIVIADVLLAAIGAFRLDEVHRSKVTWLGKTRTALIMVGLPMQLLASGELANTVLAPLSSFVLAVGCVVHVIVAVHYAWRLFNMPPEENPERV